jgi:glycosyltransferase involved in cell wall biosynthesis
MSVPACASAARAGSPAPRAPAPAARRGGRPLSILHLITRLERGGSSDCTLLQAIGAARRGHHVTVASGPTERPAPLVETAGRESRLRLVTIASLGRAVRPVRDGAALMAIARLIRAGRFDVIHTHTSKAGALGRIAAALLGRRRSVVHQPHGHLFYGYYGPLGSALVRAAERLLAPLTALHVTLSRRGAEEHLALGVGRPARFRVLRSGIVLGPLRRAPARREACRRRLGFDPDDFVVGCLGRLEPVKGPVDLLAGFLSAARGRPRLRLFLAGDGPLRESLARAAREAGLSDRVTVAGAWLSPAEVLPALDLFVLPSRNEGMGRALVEAMACRLPVVACAVGGIPEVLEEGRDGLLVPPADPEALALAIGRAADDAPARLELARRARARAVVFGAGRMVRDLLSIYREVAP